MDLLTREILVGATVPLAASFAAGAGTWHGAREGRNVWRERVLVAALCIVYVVTHLVAFGRLVFPPRSAAEATPFAVVIVGAGLIASTFIAAERARWPVFLLAFVPACALIARNFLANSWGPGMASARLAAMGACALAAAWGAARSARSMDVALGSVVLVIPACGASVALATGYHTLSGAQVAGVGASMLLALGAASLAAPRLALRPCIAVLPVSIVMLALWLGHVAAPTDWSWAAIFLLIAGFWAPAVVEHIFAGVNDSVRMALKFLGAALPSAGAIVLLLV